MADVLEGGEAGQVQVSHSVHLCILCDSDQFSQSR